jgi:hypothetical protein
MDFTILNTSVNMSAVNLSVISEYSYTQKVCSPVAVPGGVCQLNKTFSPNETYWDFSGSCKLNLTCSGTSFYCPSCPIPPTPPTVVNFTDIVYPFEENISWYSNWTDYCHINLTVAQCPMARLNVPINYSVVSNEQLNNLTYLANQGYNCYKDYAKLMIDKDKVDMSYQDLSQNTCRIGKGQLLDCVKGLANFEKEYLIL